MYVTSEDREHVAIIIRAACFDGDDARKEGECCLGVTGHYDSRSTEAGENRPLFGLISYHVAAAAHSLEKVRQRHPLCYQFDSSSGDGCCEEVHYQWCGKPAKGVSESTGVRSVLLIARKSSLLPNGWSIIRARESKRATLAHTVSCYKAQ